MPSENVAARRDLRKTLRDRYEARSRRSCFPCRERKVHCDRQQPCSTCTKRGHTDLCSYPNAPNRRRHHEDSHPERGIEPQVSNPPSCTRAGQDCIENQNESTHSLFLGTNSLVAMARQNGSPRDKRSGRQEAFEAGIFPLLGMEPQTTDSHGIGGGEGLKPASTSIPSDQETVELFGNFKSRVYPFQPVSYQIGHIESIVSSLLGREDDTQEMATPLLCLFHAILAAGAQFSDRPIDQRTALSHKHLGHALKYLGTFEVLWNPAVETIQGLIVLAQVLQNDLNPRAAWILSGITIRSAICLGIHKTGPRPEGFQMPAEDAAKLRLAIVWQDALLSMAFGRNPTSQELDHETDLRPLNLQNPENTRITYQQAMNWICHLSMKFSISRVSTPDIAAYNAILEAFDAIDASCMRHIREKKACQSIVEVQEHYSFILHKNFSVSFFCRPIFSTQGRRNLSEDDAQVVLNKVLGTLKQSSRAFLSLRSIAKISSRSWAFLHNGLCSALMLGFIEQTKGTEETIDIQTKIIQSLEEDEDPRSGSLSNAHQKALRALKAQRKLAEESIARSSEPRQLGPEAISATPLLPESSIPQQNILDSSSFSPFDMDEWVRSVDFGSYSPLEAYDFIMSDQFAPGAL